MKGHLDGNSVVVWDVCEDELDGVENHHETWSRVFQVATDDTVEFLDFGRGQLSGYSKLADERQKCARWDTASTKGNDGIESGVVPVLDVVLGHEFGNLSLGQECSLEVKTRKFVLTGLVNRESVTEPFVGFTCRDEFSGTQGVAGFSQISRVNLRDVFKGIAETVGKVISWVNLWFISSGTRKKTRYPTPLVTSSVVRRELDSVGNGIPHVRVTAAQVHLHPQTSRLLRVFSVFHAVKLVQRFLDGSISMNTGDWVSLPSSTIFLDLLG